jgi:hypothetical protein
MLEERDYLIIARQNLVLKLPNCRDIPLQLLRTLVRNCGGSLAYHLRYIRTILCPSEKVTDIAAESNATQMGSCSYSIVLSSSMGVHKILC